MTAIVQIVVTVAEGGEEHAWRVAMAQMLGPPRRRRWSTTDTTLLRLLYHIRKSLRQTQDPIAVPGSAPMPHRNPPGSDRWFTPAGR